VNEVVTLTPIETTEITLGNVATVLKCARAAARLLFPFFTSAMESRMPSAGHGHSNFHSTATTQVHALSYLGKPPPNVSMDTLSIFFFPVFHFSSIPASYCQPYGMLCKRPTQRGSCWR
jgi:hypothetical protein